MDERVELFNQLAFLRDAYEGVELMAGGEDVEGRWVVPVLKQLNERFGALLDDYNRTVMGRHEGLKVVK